MDCHVLGQVGSMRVVAFLEDLGPAQEATQVASKAPKERLGADVAPLQGAYELELLGFGL